MVVSMLSNGVNTSPRIFLGPYFFSQPSCVDFGTRRNVMDMTRPIPARPTASQLALRYPALMSCPPSLVYASTVPANPSPVLKP